MRSSFSAGTRSGFSIFADGSRFCADFGGHRVERVRFHFVSFRLFLGIPSAVAVDGYRLVALKKANKKLITQAEAATELELSLRHVKRLLKALRERGDRAVVHALRGRESNRKIDPKVREEVVKILSADVYRGFGATLASEHLAKDHGIEVSRETLRKWMQAAGLWKGKRRRSAKVHVWRERRTRCGELVQWDTSDHDWLEGRRSEPLYLISMIDDGRTRSGSCCTAGRAGGEPHWHVFHRAGW